MRRLASAPVTVLGKGRSLVGGYDQVRSARVTDVEKVLVDGFFPECARDAEPSKAAAPPGCRSWGCRMSRTPASLGTSRSFCSRQSEVARRAARLPPRARRRESRGRRSGVAVGAMLFNGGVFKADRVAKPVPGRPWGRGRSRAKSDAASGNLAGADLDLAVARGAAYYGLVKPRQRVYAFVAVQPGRITSASRPRTCRPCPGFAAAGEGTVCRSVRHGRRNRSGHPEPTRWACESVGRGAGVPLPGFDGAS